MQLCPNCRQELTADALARGFCEHCGARVSGQSSPRISLSLQRATYTGEAEEKSTSSDVRDPDAPPTLQPSNQIWNRVKNFRNRLQSLIPRKPNEQHAPPTTDATNPSGTTGSSAVAGSAHATVQQAPDTSQNDVWAAASTPSDQDIEQAAFSPSYPFSPAAPMAEEPPTPEPEQPEPAPSFSAMEEEPPPATPAIPDFAPEMYTRPPEPIAAPPPPPFMLPAEPASGPVAPYIPSPSQPSGPALSGPQQPLPPARSGPIPYPDAGISQPFPHPYQTPGYPLSGPMQGGYPGSPYSGPAPLYSPAPPTYPPMGPGIYQQQGSGMYGHSGPLPAIEAPLRRRERRQRRRRAGRGFFVGFLTALILLSAAVGGLYIWRHPELLHQTTAAAPTPTSTPSVSPTPTIPSGFKLYNSPDGIFQITYPSDWEVVYKQPSNGSSQATIRSLDSTDAMMIEPAFTAITPGQYADTLSNLLSSLAVTNAQIASTTDTVTIGANTWTSLMATANVNGNSYQFVLYGLDHNGNTAIVLTSAPDSNAGNVDAQYFQPMLQSFSFLS